MMSVGFGVDSVVQAVRARGSQAEDPEGSQSEHQRVRVGEHTRGTWSCEDEEVLDPLLRPGDSDETAWKPPAVRSGSRRIEAVRLVGGNGSQHRPIPEGGVGTTVQGLGVGRADMVMKSLDHQGSK